MEQIFLTVLNMSLAASVVIAVVLLARLLLRRAPKKWSYLLWSVVAFRLCCPVSLKAAFSVFRLKPLQGAATAVTDTAGRTSAITYIPHITAPATAPVTTPAVPVTPVAPVAPVTPTAPAAPITPVTPVTPVAPAPGVTGVPAAAEAVQSATDLMTVLTWVALCLWIAGIAAMIGCSIYNYLKMRRLVSEACLVRDNIYETDNIRTPFILGLWRPRIYVPMGLPEEQLAYVLAHESYHLRRRDHIIKTLSYLLLAVHWFNPLVWLAFHLMVKDMEMSCDEKVLDALDGANRAYSSTLLSFATTGRFPAATPLCFGESSVSSRIRNALRWRKPKAWVTLTAAVLCIVAFAACAANPSVSRPEPEPDLKPVVFMSDTTLVCYKTIDRKGPEFAGTGGLRRFSEASSQMIRQILECHTFVDDPAFLESSGATSMPMGPGDVHLLMDGTFYYVFLDTGELLKGSGEYLRATEPLTPKELAVIRQYAVRGPSNVDFDVTEKKDETLHLTAWGDTIHFELTVMLPESWAGRYEYRAYRGSTSGVTFYCKAAYDETAGSETPQGRLFWIDVVPGFVSPDTPLSNNSRVLAAMLDCSVILMYPEDASFTEETDQACRAMYDDIGMVKVELSDTLTANSINAANWNPNAVALFAFDETQNSWGAPVICDPEVSSSLGQMLESRDFSSTIYRTGNVCAVYQGVVYQIVTDSVAGTGQSGIRKGMPVIVATEEENGLLHRALGTSAVRQ